VVHVFGLVKRVVRDTVAEIARRLKAAFEDKHEDLVRPTSARMIDWAELQPDSGWGVENPP
jgi:hypothetical protein